MKAAVFCGTLALTFGGGGAARAHEFIVYFEPGSINFAAGSPGPGANWYRRVVADAACYGRRPGVTSLRVVAHTDSAGPAAVNRALSQARGDAIADLLVRFGVPRSRVIVEGRGESQPAVPAGDDASEPLNRRAVIFHEGDLSGPACDGSTLPRFTPPLPSRQPK